MRLHVRSVTAVALLLILFIVFAYITNHLNEETKIRIKQNQERASRKTVNRTEIVEAHTEPQNQVEPHRYHHTEPQNQVEVHHYHHTEPQNQVKPHHYHQTEQAHHPTEGPRTERTTKSLSKIIEHYPIFQPTEEVEFPTKDGVEPRIPHIIHQIFINMSVIGNYSGFIKTFTRNNPKWEYRFWSYESGRRLIADRHPYLLSTFDNLSPISVKKSDFIKYAALYEFGGLYADLDVKNYRPLDIVTMKFACIIPPEPFEHSSFIFKSSLLLNAGILMCRPKHPFFKALLLNLKGVDPMSYPVHTTGSQYITKQYLKYAHLTERDLNKQKTDNNSNTPYFYKGARDEEDNDAIYIPNSQYFNDKIDEALIGEVGIPKNCQKFQAVKHLERLLLLPPLTMRGCAEFVSRKKIRERKKYTFTEHFCHHMWMMSYPWILSLEKLHIKDIVPHAVLY